MKRRTSQTDEEKPPFLSLYIHAGREVWASFAEFDPSGCVVYRLEFSIQFHEDTTFTVNNKWTINTTITKNEE